MLVPRPHSIRVKRLPHQDSPPQFCRNSPGSAAQARERLPPTLRLNSHRSVETALSARGSGCYVENRPQPLNILLFQAFRLARINPYSGVDHLAALSVSSFR